MIEMIRPLRRWRSGKPTKHAAGVNGRAATRAASANSTDPP
jgi:hypothetical protein